MYISISKFHTILILIFSLSSTFISAQELDSITDEDPSDDITFEQKMNKLDEEMAEITSSTYQLNKEKSAIEEQAQSIENKGVNNLNKTELETLLKLKNEFTDISKQEVNTMGEKTGLMRQKTMLMKDEMKRVQQDMEQKLNDLAEQLQEKSPQPRL